MTSPAPYTPRNSPACPVTPPQNNAPISEADLVSLAQTAIEAHLAGDHLIKKQSTERILAQFGLEPMTICDFEPEELRRLATTKGGKIGPEVLAASIAIVSISRSNYSGNQFGGHAFALAECAVELNPFNPELIRLLWSSLRRNQTDGPVSFDHKEKNREFVKTSDVLEEYLTNGLGLRAPDFELPSSWSQAAPQWRRHVGFAVENLAGLLAAQAIEQRKRAVGLEPVIAFQNEAISLCMVGLKICGAPSSETEISALSGGTNAGGWRKVDNSQYARVGRLFQILAGIYGERPKEFMAKSRCALAAKGAATLSEQHVDALVRNDSWEVWLTRDPLGKPNAALEQIRTAAAVTPPVAIPAPLIPAPVLGTPPKTAPTAGTPAPGTSLQMPPVPAPSRPDSRNLLRSQGAAVKPREPTEPRRSSPEARDNDWAGFFASRKVAAEEKVTLKTLEALASKMKAAKLPVDTLPETRVLAALAQSSFWASAAGTGKPNEVAALLAQLSKANATASDEDPSLSTLLNLLSAHGALLAFNTRHGTGLGRLEKTILKTQIGENEGTLTAVAEALELDRSMGKLKQLFELVRIF